jgi:hypothetical protein
MPLDNNEPYSDWETSVVQASVTPADPDHAQVKRYSIVIKRNDRAYKWFSTINTISLVTGVLLIAGIFGMVAYILCNMTNASEIVQQIQNQRP